MSDTSIPSAPPPAAEARHRRPGPLLFSLLIAVLVCYIASPYYSVWRFIEAVRIADAPALAARVNFPEVREAMKRQLRDHFFSSGKRANKSRLDNIIAGLGPSLIDQVVDAYLTPDGLAALLANPKLAAASAQPTLPAPNGDAIGRRQNVNRSKVRYAFFSSPREFLVDLNGTKLRFRFVGVGWQLWRAELPLDATVGKR